MASAAGVTLQNSPPLLHFARKLEVLIWRLQKISISPLSNPTGRAKF